MDLDGFWDKFTGRQITGSSGERSHGVRLQGTWNSLSLEGMGFNPAQGLEADI